MSQKNAVELASGSENLPSLKILLINPPNSGRSIPEEEYGIDTFKQLYRGEPLGLVVLAGALDGHQVRIVDLKVETVSIGDEVRQFSPDIVDITGMTCEANAVLQIARDVRSASGAKIVVGGVHASNDPEFFNREEVDYIVVGLGKRSFQQLATALAHDKTSPDIAGIAMTNPGEDLKFKHRNYCKDDLVEDAPPRYDLVKRYWPEYVPPKLGMRMGMVVSAYGCPYRCTFCCVEALTDGHYLTHSVETILRDINLISECDFIRLVDANTFGIPEHSIKLCEALKKHDIRKKILADIRADFIVERQDIIRSWKEVGLSSAIVGFENIDSKALKELNKNCDADQNTEAIRILKEIGINIVGDFIVSPDSDHSAFDNLERYLDDNPINILVLSILTPIPGTPLYHQRKKQITNHNLDYYTMLNAVTPTKLPEKEFYQRYAGIMSSAHEKMKYLTI